VSDEGRGKQRRAAERVAGQIRNAIVSGALTSRDNLPAEAQMSEIFSVSRPTFREAIRILEGENLIRVARGPRGGARVKSITPALAAKSIGQTLQASRTLLADLFHARLIIEPPAARMAAEANSSRAAAALRKQIIAEYGSLGEVAGMARNMSDFHIRLMEVSGNNTLALVGRALQEIILTHMSLIDYGISSSDSLEARFEASKVALKSHERLADLIEMGDGVGAEEHWRQHMERFIPHWMPPPHNTALLNVLESYPTIPNWPPQS
jgi:GntR family transcriptional regulator, transcriptional repressor for pyruvate dehydrogenase complex